MSRDNSLLYFAPNSCCWLSVNWGTPNDTNLYIQLGSTIHMFLILHVFFFPVHVAVQMCIYIHMMYIHKK